ncbi:unnamed protein product [Calicophoron daubneyi]|uniref:MARVEL domain-containing protein n=1 Tax=Calicophoron daubneyi TaxID=300641 RepID=A0AAV2TB55_CALDB
MLQGDAPAHFAGKKANVVLRTPVDLRSRDYDLDWGLFTLSSGLLFLLVGLCACLIQVSCVIQSLRIQCYAVGMWSASGFLICAIFAVHLYVTSPVRSVKMVLVTVICDGTFAIALQLAAAIVAGRCAQNRARYLGVCACSFIGMVVGFMHMTLFIQKIRRLRFSRN